MAAQILGTDDGVNLIPFDEWDDRLRAILHREKRKKGKFCTLPIDCFVDLKLVIKRCNSQKEFSCHCLDLFKKNYSSNNSPKIKHEEQTLGWSVGAFVIEQLFKESIEACCDGFKNSLLWEWFPKYFCACCQGSFNEDIKNEHICSKCLQNAFTKGTKHYIQHDDHVKGENIEGQFEGQQCKFYESNEEDLHIIENIFKAYRPKMQLYCQMKAKVIYESNGAQVEGGPGGGVSDESRLAFSKINFDLLQSDNIDRTMRQIYENGRTVFVHCKEIRSGNALYKGQEIEFNIKIQNDGKRKAINVNCGDHNNNQWMDESQNQSHNSSNNKYNRYSKSPQMSRMNSKNDRYYYNDNPYDYGYMHNTGMRRGRGGGYRGRGGNMNSRYRGGRGRGGGYRGRGGNMNSRYRGGRGRGGGYRGRGGNMNSRYRGGGRGRGGGYRGRGGNRNSRYRGGGQYSSMHSNNNNNNNYRYSNQNRNYQ
eukprot:887605_1